jgi:hypothetical protein
MREVLFASYTGGVFASFICFTNSCCSQPNIFCRWRLSCVVAISDGADGAANTESEL